jgi:hypothetical protein
VRAVNAVANVAVLASATVDNAAGFDSSYANGLAKELQETEQAVRDAAGYLQDDGAFKSYDKAVARTTDAFGGDPEAWSDVSATLTTLAAPTRAAGAPLEEAGNVARRIAADAAMQAREAAQQAQNCGAGLAAGRRGAELG